MECITELDCLCKHTKKVRSSQPVILVVNWIKRSFSLKYREDFIQSITIVSLSLLLIGEDFTMEVFLTLSRRRPLSYRNQSIDLLRKSMDWFLYDNGLRLERVKVASDIFNSRSRRDCTNNTITIFFLLWFFRTYIFPTTCCTSCTRSFLFIWLDEWPNDFTIRRFKVKTFYYFSTLIDQLFTQFCRHHRNFDRAGYFQATLDKRRSSTICRPQRCFDSCATIQKKFSYM